MAGSPGKRQHNSNRMFLGSPWPPRWPWCSWWSPFGLHLDIRRPFSQASTLPAPPSQADASSLQQQHPGKCPGRQVNRRNPSESWVFAWGVFLPPERLSTSRHRALHSSSTNAEAKRQIDSGPVSSSFPLQSHQTGPREHRGALAQ